MERRVSARYPVQFTLDFLGQHTVGVGSASDLSTGGCAVEGNLIVHEGWNLELRLYLPGQDLPMEVVAMVQWTQGQKFGLKFLRMEPEQQERLQRFISSLEAGPTS